MVSVAVQHSPGWTVLGTDRGVQWATPSGVVPLPDAWIDGGEPGSKRLADLLGVVQVVPA